jgi:glycine hydroxymethyltransferase
LRGAREARARRSIAKVSEMGERKAVVEAMLEAVGAVDPEVARLIAAEEDYERDTIRLIASENYASRAVMAATGSVFTNKYCEGYAGKRYYLGQEFVDKIETLAIDRARAVFGAEHINVQPYSGSPANLAVYYALAAPGSNVLGMDLPHGGHLTHGWGVNFSGHFFKGNHYQVDPVTELLDYDKIREQAMALRPEILICGASAYPRVIDFEAFASIAKDSGAKLVADIAHISGLVAAGVHPSPVPVADVVSTTTHKTLRGPRGGMIMCKQEYAKAIDKAVFPGLQGGPHMHAIAGLAVALEEALRPDFKQYAAQIVANARAMASALTELGWRLVSGGTDNHLLLMDISAAGIGGKTAALAMEAAGIIANANTVPYDKRKPFDPSGVRIGTAAVTTRGMKEAEMRQIAAWIDESIRKREDQAALAAIGGQVRELCQSFPVP